jgi:hypothetical protein
MPTRVVTAVAPASNDEGIELPPLGFLDLPADDAPVVDALAWLACVDGSVMRAALASVWTADHSVDAKGRLHALRNAHVLKAAHLRSLQPPKRQGVRLLVDEMIASGQCRTKRRAFDVLANQQGIDWQTVRNAYYANTPT